jgi:N-acetylglucosamine kinase-like BadF-type ATPase
MTLLVGIDVGASHTEAAASDSSLHAIARSRGRDAALSAATLPASIDTINQVTRLALERLAKGTAVDALVVGAAGAGNRELCLVVEAGLRAVWGPGCSVAVTTDGEIALHSAFGHGLGITLCAGSGSIAYARDGSGQIWRAGGMGWQFGDEGSGYSLARAALAAICQAADGRGPETDLTAHLAGAVGEDSPQDIVRWAESAGRPAVAQLATVVSKCAGKGDPVAAQLVYEAARDLARHVAALARHFPAASTIPVALGGGVLSSDNSVRHAFAAVLHEFVPRAALADVRVDSAFGALALAAEAAESGRDP